MVNKEINDIRLESERLLELERRIDRAERTVEELRIKEQSANPVIAELLELVQDFSEEEAAKLLEHMRLLKLKRN